MKADDYGALWYHEKDGKPCLTGVIGGVRVIAFPNRYKRTGPKPSKQPDWKVLKSRKQA